ncbi:ABC transporter ATP-binding protein [Paenibacillus validus]|uniref:ABC transporter ATP-binding protein n=1 Tax=Paenibacillus validus TaxID=44253 RepID=UPI000FD8671C|nr:ABC transporter ATP-binding protein [Paenibacillus validus]MED4602843.1 ABC transporter ATP-binding protein [Paenibacillus validus]MED4607315.1 ABC transporter ATP-binding protein [Paenibacillus validus]
MTAILEVKAASAAYGQIQALRGVNLDVYEGEVVALIGSNGAGKSTLLKTISGIIRPTNGEIRFNGAPIHQEQTHVIVKSGLVHVPEGRAILKRMTIEDNLLTGGMYASKQDTPHLLAHVYDIFPLLRDRRHHPAGTLSGGQQQMLAIARGLMAQPKLLMLDEPSLGLAPLVIKEIFGLIQTLKASGMTILLVEQNARQALRIADRGYVIENGGIKLADRANALLHNDMILQAYLGGAHSA